MDKKIRLLQLSHSFPSPECNWRTPFLLSFFQSLEKFKSDNFRQFFLIPNDPSKHNCYQNIKYFELNPKNKIPHKRIGLSSNKISILEKLSYIANGTKSALKLIKSEECNLIHAHWTIPSGLIALICLIIKKIPYVITTHGRDVINEPQYNYDFPNSFLNKFLLKIILRKASFVLTTSQITSQATLVIQPKANIFQIPIGIESEWILQFKSKKNTSSSIIIGDYLPRKGIEFVINEFKKKPNNILNVVGLKDDNLPNIFFHGYLDREKLAELIKENSILIFSSTIEAFGVVLIEALSAGLKVVGTNTGILAELSLQERFKNQIFIFSHGDSNSFSSALEKALSSKESIDLTSIQNYFFSNYSWDVIAKNHIELYRKC